MSKNDDPLLNYNIIYLSPTFYPYRIPVYEKLYDILGDNFKVVALAEQKTANAKLAIKMGKFHRVLIRGRFLSLSNNPESGKESPFGILITPSFPFQLTRLNPDIVISNNFSIWTLLSILMGYKTILFWEGTQHTERTIQMWRHLIRKWMIKKIKAFVVNGKLASKYLKSEFNIKQSIIFEGGMCPNYNPKNNSLIKNDNIHDVSVVRFLFCGRLIKLKGVNHLLFAVKLLLKNLPEGKSFDVVIVGDGSERIQLQEMTKELELENHVKFIGAIPSYEVWSYYQNSHVFILPTLQDNWPLVVPEAMFSGKPILLSKYAGSVADLIREGKNGYSFYPEDHYRLSKLMLEYIITPKQIIEHGLTSIEIVSKYTPENVAKVFIEAMKSVSGFKKNNK